MKNVQLSLILEKIKKIVSGMTNRSCLFSEWDNVFAVVDFERKTVHACGDGRFSNGSGRFSGDMRLRLYGVAWLLWNCTFDGTIDGR